MSETIFIGVAWPYANGPLHQGQMVGSFLPADVFARYHRLAGNRVLMVSGSDQHGTPITVRAEREGRTPEEIVAEFHKSFQESLDWLGISMDLFTTTGTETHRDTVQQMFLKLHGQGDIYPDSMMMLFCPNDQRFLPDRYVEGTCPNCAYESARGDECENCGRSFDATELLDPGCKLCGTKPEPRETRHFFLRLSAYNDRLRKWVEKQSHWRKHVVGFTLGMLNEGLRDRAITRDLEWGIPIPVDDLGPGKRLYVWFENVIGYLSASKEWAQRQGTPDAWRDFWQATGCRSYYFLGKDNIFFHTLSWPMEIMAFGEEDGGLNLPYDVPANQFMNIGGQKASTSRMTAIFIPDVMGRVDADAMRYYLCATMPETADSDFTWTDFVARNNNELVATWGNLVNRVLTMTYRNFDGHVPDPGGLDERSEALLQRTEAMLVEAGEHIATCHFRAGLQAALAHAQEANKYLDETAPWKALPNDRESAARSLYTALCAVNGLKVAMSPYIPFSSERLHAGLGFEAPMSENAWTLVRVPPGQQLQEPVALFKKLELEQVEPSEVLAS